MAFLMKNVGAIVLDANAIQFFLQTSQSNSAKRPPLLSSVQRETVDLLEDNFCESLELNLHSTTSASLRGHEELGFALVGRLPGLCASGKCRWRHNQSSTDARRSLNYQDGGFR
jgi:hypothetical protein